MKILRIVGLGVLIFLGIKAMEVGMEPEESTLALVEQVGLTSEEKATLDSLVQHLKKINMGLVNLIDGKEVEFPTAQSARELFRKVAAIPSDRHEHEHLDLLRQTVKNSYEALTENAFTVLQLLDETYEELEQAVARNFKDVFGGEDYYRGTYPFLKLSNEDGISATLEEVQKRLEVRKSEMRSISKSKYRTEWAPAFRQIEYLLRDKFTKLRYDLYLQGKEAYDTWQKGVLKWRKKLGNLVEQEMLNEYPPMLESVYSAVRKQMDINLLMGAALQLTQELGSYFTQVNEKLARLESRQPVRMVDVAGKKYFVEYEHIELFAKQLEERVKKFKNKKPILTQVQKSKLIDSFDATKIMAKITHERLLFDHGLAMQGAATEYTVTEQFYKESFKALARQLGDMLLTLNLADEKGDIKLAELYPFLGVSNEQGMSMGWLEVDKLIQKKKEELLGQFEKEKVEWFFRQLRYIFGPIPAGAFAKTKYDMFLKGPKEFERVAPLPGVAPILETFNIENFSTVNFIIANTLELLNALPAKNDAS